MGAIEFVHHIDEIFGCHAPPYLEFEILEIFRISMFGQPSFLFCPFRTLDTTKVVDPTQLMKGFRRIDLGAAESVSLQGLFDGIRRIRARFDHIEAEVANRLKASSGRPERDVAKSAQRSNRHGTKVIARAAALENEPTLNCALEAGDLGGEHVAGFAPAPTERPTGMWHLSGAFDPESGVTLHGRLEAEMSALFAAKTPPTAPTHPGDKQDHLRALALLALTNVEPASSASLLGASDGD